MQLSEKTFQIIVLISILPAILAVLTLALGAQDVAVTGQRAAPKFALKTLGRTFHGLHGDRRAVRAGQLLGRLPGAARPGTRLERDRDPGHAGNLQPGIHPGFDSSRLAIRSESAGGE